MMLTFLFAARQTMEAIRQPVVLDMGTQGHGSGLGTHACNRTSECCRLGCHGSDPKVNSMEQNGPCHASPPLPGTTHSTNKRQCSREVAFASRPLLS